MPKTLNYRDPIGVLPPVFAASLVMADFKDDKAGRAKFHPERAPIILAAAEAQHRADLLAGARRGDKRAIAALLLEYRLRLVGA